MGGRGRGRGGRRDEQWKEDIAKRNNRDLEGMEERKSRVTEEEKGREGDI